MALVIYLNYYNGFTNFFKVLGILYYIVHVIFKISFLKKNQKKKNPDHVVQMKIRQERQYYEIQFGRMHRVCRCLDVLRQMVDCPKMICRFV